MEWRSPRLRRADQGVDIVNGKAVSNRLEPTRVPTLNLQISIFLTNFAFSKEISYQLCIMNYALCIK